MRSIRTDLEERLAAFPMRRRTAQERYEAELRAIERDERLVRDMLALEQRLEQEELPFDEEEEGERTFPFGAANESEAEILSVMSDRKDWDHAALKVRLPDIKARRGADDTSFGRILHGMLMSMKGRGLVEHAGVGTWRITQAALAKAA
jgi:hypothetical protein